MKGKKMNKAILQARSEKDANEIFFASSLFFVVLRKRNARVLLVEE